MITCRPGIDADILKIGKLREHEELFIISGMCPLLYMSYVWSGSIERMAIVMDGKVIGLYGIHGKTPWLVGTDELPKASKTLVKIGIKTVSEWKKKYSDLMTYVSRNYGWMKRIGFRFTGETVLNGKIFKIARL